MAKRTDYISVKKDEIESYNLKTDHDYMMAPIIKFCKLYKCRYRDYQIMENLGYIYSKKYGSSYRVVLLNIPMIDWFLGRS